jgi:hypothetical protein
MDLNSSRPLGDQTTVIDIADRDDMDDDMFPLTTSKSWFTRNSGRRTLNFSPVIQEFTNVGTAEFGGTLVFEIGSVKACDLLFSVALQIQLGHWFPPTVVEAIQNQIYTYATPDAAWFYANSLGTALIAKAEFLLEDQVLETVDGDFASMFGVLYSDVNTQFGVGTDGAGRVPIPVLNEWRPYNVFPTTNGFISCILPFSFQRIRLKNGFPLTSCKEGTVRVKITLRPFDQCVRIAKATELSPPVPGTCKETPLGKTFTFNVEGGGTVNVVAASTPPPFADTRLVTYGVLVDGKLRHALLKAPFDRLYRDVMTFRFDEPKKYVVNTPGNGVVSLQLPLEVNGPVEEIMWFIRRKAVSVNNEWTNFSNRLEYEFDGTTLLTPIFRPFQSMLVSANLQVDGISLIQAEGDFFRREISTRHRGGVVAYNSFVYGYAFSQNPGAQNPTGWMNASRSQDVRLRMDIKPPGGGEDLEFEVVVYCLSLNWVRFQNGIANKVFSS